MAMNIATLRTALISRIQSEMATQLSIYDDIADDNRLTAYTFAEYRLRFATALATAISNEVLNHITTNARCIGTDSNGDSHGSVQIE